MMKPVLIKLPENPDEFNEYMKQNIAVIRVYMIIAIIIFILIMLLLFKISL